MREIPRRTMVFFFECRAGLLSLVGQPLDIGSASKRTRTWTGTYLLTTHLCNPPPGSTTAPAPRTPLRIPTPHAGDAPLKMTRLSPQEAQQALCVAGSNHRMKLIKGVQQGLEHPML
jgi:hypothetical protein